MSAIDVLYIAGSGRSGSTLLSRLLGEVEGVVNVGQAAFHYTGQCPPIPCGCGVRVDQCGFWKDIPANSRLQEMGQRFFRKRHFPRLVITGAMGNAKARDLMFSLGALYQSIAEKTGAEVIVDCSKNPARAYLLSRTPGIRLSLVHLIRSPRGVAASWQRQKEYLFEVPAWRAALSWNFVQFFSELMASPRLARVWTIRYEDLAEHPGRFVEAIAAGVLGRPVNCRFLQGNRATVKAQHMLAGNPDVFDGSGAVVVEKRNPVLPPSAEFVVSAITFPLAVRYGYLWPRNWCLAPVRLPFAYEFLQPRDIPQSGKPQIAALPWDDEPPGWRQPQ